MSPSLRTRFESLPLHDATLVRVDVEWSAHLCRMHLVAFDRTTGSTRPFVLELTGLTKLALSHDAPWGPSRSVLETRCEGDELVLAMQSGDAVRCIASDFTYRPA